MRVLIENLNEKPFGVQIEPWAQYEKIAPGVQAEIVWDDKECELQFSLTEEGEPFFGINADITFSVGGHVIFNSRKTEKD